MPPADYGAFSQDRKLARCGMCVCYDPSPRIAFGVVGDCAISGDEVSTYGVCPAFTQAISPRWPFAMKERHVR